MMLLIVGKSASGKDAVASELERRGKTSVISHTTRPRRSDGDRHVFVSEAEADGLWDSAVATTTINGYRYFATRDDVEAADIYVIDPAGFRELTANMPDTSFAVCYIRANDRIRRQKAIERADDPEAAARAFDARDAEEGPAFDDFLRQLLEDRTGYTSHMPPNVPISIIMMNDYTPECLGRMADGLQRVVWGEEPAGEGA